MTVTFILVYEVSLCSVTEEDTKDGLGSLNMTVECILLENCLICDPHA